VLHEDYLAYRVQSTAYLGRLLTEQGIPIVQPPGGHAIYIDAKAMLPHIPVSEYPAWALSLVLYLEGGIRSVEIGSVMFGRGDISGIGIGNGNSNSNNKENEQPAAMELVRLAFPRRVYTQSHVDYVAEVLAHINKVKHQIRGVKIVEQAPVLRHFTAKLEPAHGALIVP